MTVDDGTFDIVRQRISDLAIEVWMVNFSPVDETTPVKILTQQLGFPPSFFDADHVHLMLAGLEGKVFLWDVTTGAKQSLALGIRLNRVTQIYAK